MSLRRVPRLIHMPAAPSSSAAATCNLCSQVILASMVDAPGQQPMTPIDRLAQAVIEHLSELHPEVIVHAVEVNAMLAGVICLQNVTSTDAATQAEIVQQMRAGKLGLLRVLGMSPVE